jgi:hypothetical protein
MLIVVVEAVDFKHESSGRAIKVDEVLTDWLLAAKLPASNPPALES